MQSWKIPTYPIVSKNDELYVSYIWMYVLKKNIGQNDVSDYDRQQVEDEPKKFINDHM